MKRASIVIIRHREARRPRAALGNRLARRSRAAQYAHELGEDRTQVGHLLAQICRQLTREGVRHD
jgi:hypothetical protein